MDKMQMAHEHMMAMISAGCHDGMELLLRAWEYADAMQAEADKRKPSGLPDALKEEWQPDWSQAPEWAKWWLMNSDGYCFFFEDKPEIVNAIWMTTSISIIDAAPSFGYTGNWQDSLRERPE